jgi:methyl-accepting chemotaxis protein
MAEMGGKEPPEPKQDVDDEDDWWSPLGGMQDLAQARLSRLLELIQPPLRQLQELVSGQQTQLQDVISRINKRVDQLQREVERQAKSVDALRARLTKQVEALRSAQRGAHRSTPAKQTTSHARSSKSASGRTGTTKGAGKSGKT